MSHARFFMRGLVEPPYLQKTTPPISQVRKPHGAYSESCMPDSFIDLCNIFPFQGSSTLTDSMIAYVWKRRVGFVFHWRTLMAFKLALIHDSSISIHPS
jgi:hypothetical protein